MFKTTTSLAAILTWACLAGCVSDPDVAPCFSPTSSPEMSFEQPESGCACEDEASVCVPARYQRREWQVGLVCSNSQWIRVEDGPCGPSSPLPGDCSVNGRLYRDGERVPDAFSCNECTCEDGELSTCTEIHCPIECPEGTAPGTSCLACSPVDTCNRVETGCLPACETDDDCTDSDYPTCSEGVCSQVCG